MRKMFSEKQIKEMIEQITSQLKLGEVKLDDLPFIEKIASDLTYEDVENVRGKAFMAYDIVFYPMKVDALDGGWFGIGDDLVLDVITIDVEDLYYYTYPLEFIKPVVANPTLAGTESALSGLQVGDTKYTTEKIPDEIIDIQFEEDDWDDVDSYAKRINFVENKIYRIKPISSPTHSTGFYKIFASKMVTLPAISFPVTIDTFLGIENPSNLRCIQWEIIEQELVVQLINGCLMPVQYEI